MTIENIINTPPALPVRRRTSTVIAPPKPPLIPGGQPADKMVLAPPRPPADDASPAATAERQAEVAHRRQSLAESGAGDPGSTVAMFTTGLKNSLRTIPVLLKKFWWVALIIAAGWLLLSIWNPITLSMRYPQLDGLIDFLTPIVGFLIFITAAYNNWFARSIYALLIFKVFIPLGRRIRKEGFMNVMRSFKAVIPGVKTSWAECRVYALPVFIGMAGVGLALSNFLTRNNSSDKMLVSIALAVSLVKTLSDGKKSLPFMASRVITKDISKLFKKDRQVNNNQIYLGIGGLMTGLLGSIVLMILRSMLPGSVGEFIGYYLGAAVLVAGVVLYFVKRAKKA